MTGDSATLDATGSARSLRRRRVIGPYRPAPALLLPVIPGLLFLVVLYLVPLVRMVSVSAFDPGLTAKHYARIVHTPVYADVILTSLRVAALVTFACVAMGYPVAYVLATARPRARKLLLTLVVLPYLTSVLVRTFAWVVLLGRAGVVNSFLIAVGAIQTPLGLVYNTFGVVVGMTHIMLPMMILALYAVMRGIDRNLVKAAHNLGAGPFRAFFTVFLPLSFPGIAAGSLLVFIIALGFYITPALIGGLADTMIAMVIGAEIIEFLNWGFGAALGMVLLAVTLGLYFVASRYAAFDRIWGGGALEPARRSGRFATGALDVAERAMIALIRVASRFVGRASRRARAVGRLAQRRIPVVAAAVVALFLISPVIVVVILSFSSSPYLVFPPPGWALRNYYRYFGDALWLHATWTSLQIAIAATAIAVVLGACMAYGLVRGRFPGKQALLAFVLSPIIVPSVISAIALYFVIARTWLAGHPVGLMLGHVVHALPFVVVMVSASVRGVDPALESAALSLGASRIRAVFTVTLPLIRPGLVAAAFFAFLTSFDDVIYALFLGVGQVTTLPLRMWDGVKQDVSPTIAAVASLEIALAIACLFAMSVGRRAAEDGT